MTSVDTSRSISGLLGSSCTRLLAGSAFAGPAPAAAAVAASIQMWPSSCRLGEVRQAVKRERRWHMRPAERSHLLTSDLMRVRAPGGSDHLHNG